MYKELTTRTQKLELMFIIHVSSSQTINDSKASEFRRKVCLTSPKRLRFFIKQYTKREFLIIAQRTDKEGNIKSDSWIQIDDITGEKQVTVDPDSPIFDIVTVTELFEYATPVDTMPKIS